MLAGRQSSEVGIVDIARDRLSSGVTDKDNDLICSLQFVAPSLVAADRPLINSLLRVMEGGTESWSTRECINGVLSEIDFKLPSLAPISEKILSALLKQGSLSDREILIIEKGIPPDIFAQHWRKLARGMTGQARLVVYQIAASRMLAVDEAIALFRDVLAAKIDGLGVKPPTSARDMEHTYMPAAVRGLVASGGAGYDALAELLRGRGGSPLGRQVIPIELTRLDRARVGSLVPDLIAAIHDKDPQVRSATAYALSWALDGEPLVSAMRPLFSDPDQNVLYHVIDSITKSRDQPLTTADKQTVIETTSKHPYPYLREKAASLLVWFHDDLPHDFITDKLRGLLLDRDELPRRSAFDVVSSLGPPGVAAVEEAITEPEFPQLVLPISHVERLSPTDRQKLLSAFVSLQRRYPLSASLLKTVGALAGSDPVVTSLLQDDLLSDQADLRSAALETLSAQHFFSTSSQHYLAALLDLQMHHYLDPYLGNVLEIIRPYFGPVPTSGGGIPRLPTFPWPPPTWSFKEIVPRDLVGSDDVTLGQVSDRLASAIRAASADYDYGLFGIPNGFVMLARLERINPDGTPYPGRLRWDSNPIPPQTLNEYLIDLFFGPPGYFRVIALAVSSEEPIETQQKAILPSTAHGAKTLPEEIARLPFKGHQLFALVYTFERYNGAKMVLNYEGSPSGLTHLVTSGIWGKPTECPT
jgi:hypothetical protein